MYLGAHLGIAGGLDEAVRELRGIGGEALQIFSKSPQMWAGPPIALDAAERFRSAVRDGGVRATAVHHGYLLNLASPKAEGLARSRAAFRDEIARADLLGVDALIFHPGAHLGGGPEVGLRAVADSLTHALEEATERKVRLLLENSAGQGTTLCAALEDLAVVLAKVDAPRSLGVTLDTCHLFAAGVDFREESQYGTLVDRIASTVGTGAVRAFHLNDAKADLGSHLDRHENIGRGKIGLDGFRHLVNDRRWAEIPGYLETPLDEGSYARYATDLATLRSLLRPESADRPAGGGRRRPRAAASTVK
jgi:deoxyribonuclease IV